MRPDLLRPTLDLLDPGRTIVLVRDVRDVAVSLLEKSTAERAADRDRAWLESYLVDSPAAILSVTDSLAGRPYRVVRYEDFVSDESTRSDLADWLDWPLDGDAERNLAELYGRAREVYLHAGSVTSASLGRHRASTHPDAEAIAAWAADANEAYQHRFGYAG